MCIRDRVEIEGAGFGTVEENALTRVTYGPTGYEFSPCPHGADAADCHCRVSRDHDRILCDTVEGAGAGLSFVVIIEGQESVAPTVAYDRPAITGLTLAGAVDARTAGGELVNITGTNFGPPDEFGMSGNKTAFLEAVTYGPVSGDEYAAESCRVADHSSILCRTAPGIGGPALPLYWSVKVEGQTSDLSAVSTNYARPNITGISSATASTAGGAVIEVNGTNLGLSVPSTFVEVRFDDEPIAIDGGATTRVWTASSVDYAWIDPDGTENLRFVVPEMTVADQQKTLRVFIDDPAIDGVSAYTNPVAFAYGDPVITGIQSIEGAAEGMSDLTVLGDNFGNGHGGTIRVNGEQLTSTSWDHDRVELSFNGTSGNVTVTVGNRTSEPFAFADYSPVIEARCSQILTEQMTDYAISRRYTTEGLDENGEPGRVYIVGRYFYNDLTDIETTIGGLPNHMPETTCELNNATLETCLLYTSPSPRD